MNETMKEVIWDDVRSWEDERGQWVWTSQQENKQKTDLDKLCACYLFEMNTGRIAMCCPSRGHCSHIYHYPQRLDHCGKCHTHTPIKVLYWNLKLSGSHCSVLLPIVTAICWSCLVFVPINFLQWNNVIYEGYNVIHIVKFGSGYSVQTSPGSVHSQWSMEEWHNSHETPITAALDCCAGCIGSPDVIHPVLLSYMIQAVSGPTTVSAVLVWPVSKDLNGWPVDITHTTVQGKRL